MITKSISFIERREVDRPIPMLVQIASRYKSNIQLARDEKTVNAKSIMGMLNFGLLPGQEMDVCVDGEDESAAMCDLEEYLTGIKIKQ